MSESISCGYSPCSNESMHFCPGSTSQKFFCERHKTLHIESGATGRLVFSVRKPLMHSEIESISEFLQATSRACYSEVSQYIQKRNAQIQPLLKRMREIEASTRVKINHCQEKFTKLKIELKNILNSQTIVCTPQNLWSCKLIECFGETEISLNTTLCVLADFSSSPEIAEALYLQGNSYFAIKSYDLAINYHSRALAMRQKLNDHSLLTVHSMFSLGYVFYNVEDIPSALTLYLDGLELYKKVGANSPIKGSLLTNIGLAYFHLKDFDSAEKYACEACEFDQLFYGPSHPESATSLLNLANVLILKGETQNALEMYELCLEIKREAFGDEHNEVASILHNLGLIYREKGQMIKAGEYLNKCLEIREKLPGQPDIFKSYIAIAKNYRLQGQIFLSQRMLKDAWDKLMSGDYPYKENTKKLINELMNLDHDRFSDIPS